MIVPAPVPAAHAALVEAARLGLDGALHVTTAGAVWLAGAWAWPPRPAFWGPQHTQALAALRAATGAPGAWEWILPLRAGVPQGGLTWQGLDGDGERAL